MKLVPETKPDKRNKTASKDLTMTSCRKIVMSLPFFRFMSNLEQSGRRIPDAESAKLMFLLTVPFYFTKTETRSKKSLT